MYRLFVKIIHLTLLSTVNLLLVEFICILTAFHHLLISLILFTHSFMDLYEFAQIGLKYTKAFLKKNGYLEDFIGKYFKKIMDNVHVLKETTLTVGKKPLVLVLL